MQILQHKNDNNNTTLVVLIAVSIILALTSLIYAITNNYQESVYEKKESTMDRIKRTKTLRVGYGGFPPYTIVNLAEKDPSKRMSGFVVDMINEIVRQSDGMITRVEWVKLNWETYKADMDSQRFDFLADAVYYNVPKSLDYDYTIPFSYFGIGCAVVRIDDNRFKVFSDLNNSNLRISYALGYVSGPFAMRNLNKPTFIPVEVGNNAFSQLDLVINRRADVAIQDVPTVVQYVKQHPTKVKALWVENPPSRVAAGFLLRRSDTDLKNFLNVCIENMKLDGTLDKLDSLYNSYGQFEEIKFINGKGIK